METTQFIDKIPQIKQKRWQNAENLPLSNLPLSIEPNKVYTEIASLKALASSQFSTHLCRLKKNLELQANSLVPGEQVIDRALSTVAVRRKSGRCGLRLGTESAVR